MEKVVKFLCVHDGENVGTFSPMREYSEADQKLLTVMEYYCVSYDNDMLVECHKYFAKEIIIPEWMTPAEYASNYGHLAYSYALGFKIEFGRDAFFELRTQDAATRYVAYKLLGTKNFRSPFRKSLHDTLVSWFYDKKYITPFTSRQLDAFLHQNDYYAIDAWKRNRVTRQHKFA
jgi:hypothetical protein